MGAAASTTPPGTDALARVFKLAGKPVLLLFDEVLNFINRHRGMAEPFHAFIQNLVVAATVADLDAAIADEEVRSKMLEEERRAALNELETS